MTATLICGVDEAGRGPLAGKVYAAAVILGDNCPIVGIADSKKLTAKKRDFLYDEIVKHALSFSIASASVEDIDNLNILNATMLAMKRAIERLGIKPSIAIVDGNKTPKVPVPVVAVVGGDNLVLEISAASILAKVTRDREMMELDLQYPEYKFAKHKGYATKEHRDAIAKYGRIDAVHRKSFTCSIEYAK